MIDFITNLKKISNDFNKIKKYLDFIKDHKLKEYSKNSERHHILPKSVFPEFNDYNKYPENFAVLSIVNKNGRLIEKTTRIVYKTDKIIGSEMIPFKFIQDEPLIKKERTYNKTEKWFKTVENKRGKTIASNHTIASKKDFLSGKVHGVNYGKHYYFDTETLKRVLLLPENAPSPRFIIYHIAKEKGIV